MSHVCHRFWKCYKTLTFLLTFDQVHNPLRLLRESTSEHPKVLHTPQFFYTFDFETTTACTFSTSQLPKVLRTWNVFSFLTWKCASRHISHLARWLRTRRFSEPTFWLSGATNHWKNTVFRDFLTFSRTWIFFVLRLSLFELLSSSLLFSDSSDLCFSSVPVHIVRSLTSKLPSIKMYDLGVSLFWETSICWMLDANEYMHSPTLSHGPRKKKKY